MHISTSPHHRPKNAARPPARPQRCVATGELFPFAPEQAALTLGFGNAQVVAKGAPAPGTASPGAVQLDVDLAALGVAVASAAPGLVATLFRLPEAVGAAREGAPGGGEALASENDDDEHMAPFQLTVAGGEPVWVDGVECLASDEQAVAVRHNSIIEVASLRFCFACPS